MINNTFNILNNIKNCSFERNENMYQVQAVFIIIIKLWQFLINKTKICFLFHAPIDNAQFFSLQKKKFSLSENGQ